ncbi:predicted protein [Naegleria gruberi]|uniref:Predicted protein n=1 Tax=Naegleria gruberi TaxID=5762 RepID=D2VR62_NAEGR|nr:uncharacterized protein NAEGRDRAFT_71474 [Naegleria gruberi]EFC40841.1 predicted protein [Naegleria gruberi]|eukprot:XP_002673585.1 predicted protein [Naegleria gruberi strain NEG-M]
MYESQDEIPSNKLPPYKTNQLSFSLTIDGYNVVTTKDKHATVIYDVTFTVKSILPVDSQSPSKLTRTKSQAIVFTLSVAKRYSELRDLYKQLSSITHQHSETSDSSQMQTIGATDVKYDFPGKIFFGNTNPETIEKRKTELQHFLDQVTMQLVLENRLEGSGGEIYKRVLKFFEINETHHI